jgi:hypothetical protein
LKQEELDLWLSMQFEKELLHGTVAKVHFLLTHGISIDGKNSAGYSWLFFSICNPGVSAEKRLIFASRVSDPNVRHPQG